MAELNWLHNKTIASAHVQRADQGLELVMATIGHPQEFVMKLGYIGATDWLGTDYLSIEDMVGRTVIGTEILEREVPGEDPDYTYVLMFQDATRIDIFADVRSTYANGNTFQIREALELFLRTPHTDDWDENDTSILEELDAAVEAARQRREELETGELLPQYRARY